MTEPFVSARGAGVLLLLLSADCTVAEVSPSAAEGDGVVPCATAETAPSELAVPADARVSRFPPAAPSASSGGASSEAAPVEEEVAEEPEEEAGGFEGLGSLFG